MSNLMMHLIREVSHFKKDLLLPKQHVKFNDAPRKGSVPLQKSPFVAIGRYMVLLFFLLESFAIVRKDVLFPGEQGLCIAKFTEQT
jgi:hypothetical protein